MPRAVSQPLKTFGMLVTMMAGSKKRWRNLLVFQAWTQAWLLSHAAICSACADARYRDDAALRPKVDALSVDGLGGSRYLEFSALSREDHIVNLYQEGNAGGCAFGHGDDQGSVTRRGDFGIELDTLETGKTRDFSFVCIEFRAFRECQRHFRKRLCFVSVCAPGNTGGRVSEDAVAAVLVG